MKKQHETVINNLEKRIDELEAIIKKPHTKEPLDPKVPSEVEETENLNDTKKEIIEHARKTIGLHSVNYKDLCRIRRTQGITDEEEIKIALAREYFKCEMRMNDDDIETLNISKVFYAAKNPEWNSLYVQFSDSASLPSAIALPRT